jgi:diaminopimelate epimerase
MRFVKMHGAGNDFIVIDDRARTLPDAGLPALAKRVCARHTGVGADGMMVVRPAAQGGDYAMLYFNADGSLGEMCGNGARCICRYGHDAGLAGEVQRVETTAGLVTGEHIEGARYRVRLNDPSVLDRRTARVGEEDFPCWYAELGDPGIPHAVVVLDDWDTWDQNALRELGRALRYAPVFPKGANVSFVRFLGEDRIKAVTFERGVEDFTLACGTGCGSLVSALTREGLVSGRDVQIEMPGGTLTVSVTDDGGTIRNIFLTGPTCVVCEGELKEL